MTRGFRATAFVLLVGSSAAHAQGVNAVAAESAFQRAGKLMEAKDYRAACEAYEQSHKLDPQIGTLFNLARCNVEIGKLASAWTAFREVAQRDTNAARKAKAQQLAAQLEPRLPKVVVTVRPSPDKIALDGVDITSLAGVEVPIDLGPHQLTVSAAHHRELTKAFDIHEEKRVLPIAVTLEPVPSEPTVPVAAEPQPAPPTESEDDEPTPVPSSNRRTYAVVLGASGAALIGGGIVFGLLARSKWSSAQELCGQALMCPDDDAYTRGSEYVDQATTRSTIATGLTIAGIVGVAAGVTLYVTASSQRDRVAVVPAVGSDAVGVVVSGRY